MCHFFYENVYFYGLVFSTLQDMIKNNIKLKLLPRELQMEYS